MIACQMTTFGHNQVPHEFFRTTAMRKQLHGHENDARKAMSQRKLSRETKTAQTWKNQQIHPSHNWPMADGVALEIRRNAFSTSCRRVGTLRAEKYSVLKLTNHIFRGLHQHTFRESD